MHQGEAALIEFPETDPSLIARVKHLGDEASWAQFLAIYQPVVLRMARRRQLQEADAHDVMQQVLLSIMRSIEGWEPGNGRPPFRAWLTTIAKNAITKALSRQPRDRATGSSEVGELLENHPEPDRTGSEVIAEARQEIVQWAVDQVRAEFSEATWKAFQMTALEGVPAADVSSVTGRSAGAVYLARFRVTSRLKEKVQEAMRQWICWSRNDADQ